MRRRLNAAVMSGILLAVAVLSGFHAGIPVAELRLHDGGVWVTNAALRLAAHLNYPSRTLDGGVAAVGEPFDVTQSGNDVVLLDTGLGAARVVDTADLSVSKPISLAGYSYAQEAGTFAVADPTGGRVWAMASADLGSFSPESAPVLMDLPGAKVLVSVTGTVLAWDKDGNVRRVTRDGPAWRIDHAGRLSLTGDTKDVTFTAVGDDLVAFAPSTGTLTTTHSQARFDGSAGAALQLPGPQRDDVLVATADALLRVPLGGGEVRGRPADPQATTAPVASRTTPPGIAASTADGTPRPAAKPAGAPARPAVVGDCAYAAWGGTGRYLRDCSKDGDDQERGVPALATAKSLAFRVNRDVIVLNDTANGDAYVMTDKAVVVNNWKDITRQLEQREQSQDKVTRVEEQTQAADRTKQNRPPVAVADEYGARPGRSTTLPVLANDSDPDGDVLTADPTTQPGIGTVAPVRGGEALQITVPATASGAASFDYAADDGRGQKATATVKVTVRTPDVNEAPKQRREGSVTVASGRETVVNALQNWWDPDGDPMILKSATGVDGLSVRFRQDGALWVTDLGRLQPGAYKVTVIVGDGAAERSGAVLVTVLAKANAAPVANADHVTAYVGRPATLRPLANDTDANGDALRLVALAPPPAGVTVSPDLTAGTVSITAQKAGNYYLSYTISDGPASAEGIIRIVAADPRAGAPVPDADTVLLPAGGTAAVDVLANDTDPAGGVLLVQSVAVPPDSSLLVQIIDHGVLRLEAPGGLTGPTSFEYVVSNGAASATGRVTVIPMPPATPGTPPVAVADRAVVRTGDIVSIPVLANDSSPVGLPLTLAPGVQLADPALGQAFVSDGVLRFRAGGAAGTATVSYTVRDSLGQVGSGTATITIRAANDGNAAPTPRAVTARVLAGMTTRIQVPLDGVDPDGDSVTLAGLASAPAKGTAKVTGGVIEYTAPAGASGTDVFSYALTDAAGGRGVGSVAVGIAPVAATNGVPVAAPDRVVARPGRALSVPVLANDSDPDGDPLALVEGSVQATAGTTVVARAEGNRVTLVTPETPGVLAYYYEVDDGHAGRARGSVAVDVRPDAPLLPPVARDDVVSAADAAGRDSVEVDVLRNDEDPDGDVRLLTISSDDPGVRVAAGKLTVPVTDRRQVVLYTVTDADGLAARAAVFVPARAGQPPRLRDDRFPLRVKAGETLTVKLADVVVVRDGRSPRITSEAAVTASAGANGKPLVADPTTLTYTSLPTFRGLTSLNVEVTDGAAPGEAGALVALLSMPIVVEGPSGTPPTVRPAEIVVTPGQPAQRVDVGRMITDPDPGDAEKATVRLGTVSPVFTVALEGRVLVVSAAADAKDGTVGTADITVTDGSTEPVAAKIPLRVVVVEQARPPMVVTEAVIADVQPGQTRDVDITRYVTNPYADQGKALTLVGTPVVTSGAGTATASGTTVRIAVAAAARGEVVTTYAVADASGKPQRNVQGTIRVQLKVPPDAPMSVTARTDGNRAATVSWASGGGNGSPITKFTVSWAGGSKDCGVATSCVVTGLATGGEYRFTVVATSALGDSPPSAPSNPIKIAAGKPTVPGVPSAKAGDKKVDLSWAASTVEGGGAITYVVQVSPGGAQKETTATSLSWDGLTNGTAYTFRVQAKAATADPSDWSGSSAPITPLGPPGAPSGVSAMAAPVGVVVTWQAPSVGAGTLTYEVQSSDGVTRYTGDGKGAPQHGALATVLPSLDGLSFKARARNAAGWGPWSPDSASVKQSLRSPPPAPSMPNTFISGFGCLITWSIPGKTFSESVGYTYEVISTDGKYRYVGDGDKSSKYGGIFDDVVEGRVYRVRARNANGWSDWSQDSAPVKIPNQPSVNDVTAKATGRDNEVEIRFSPIASWPNGLYSWKAGGKSGSLPPGGGTVQDVVFVNGRDVPVSVVAYPGAYSLPSQSKEVTVNAYGPPKPPVFSYRSVGENVEYVWDASASANGRPIVGVYYMRYKGDAVGGGPGNIGGITGSFANSFSVYVSNPAPRIRSRDSMGGVSEWTEGSGAVVNPYLKPSFSATNWVPPGGYPSGCTPGCISTFGLGLTLRNYRANSQVLCTWRRYVGPTNKIFTVNGAGSKDPAKNDIPTPQGDLNPQSTLSCTQQ